MYKANQDKILNTITQHALAFRDFAEDYADEHSLSDRDNKIILDYLIDEYQVQVYAKCAGLPVPKIRIL